MKITNKHGLPKVFENLARRDDYTKGGAQFSVTELIAPPRIRVLQRAHEKEIERDVADMLWALVGKTMHKVLESRASDGSIPEQRLFAEVDGVVISGGIDHQIVGGDEVDITDWKFTSTWALKDDKPEWEQQLNIYSYLNHLHGRRTRQLMITAILRDWSRAEAERNPKYPQAPIQQVSVPVWPVDKQEAFIKERIRVHAQAHYLHEMGEEIPECSDEEKWMSESRWAVVKPGGKRAYRVFDTHEDAAVLATVKGYNVEERKAEPIRCKRDYCGVARWCSFGKQFHGEQT